MSEPTLSIIPGILLRTVLRLLARLLFVLAGGFLLVGLALTFLCVLLGTWRTPRGKKWQLATDVFLLVTELVKERRRMTNTESE